MTMRNRLRAGWLACALCAGGTLGCNAFDQDVEAPENSFGFGPAPNMVPAPFDPKPFEPASPGQSMMGLPPFGMPGSPGMIPPGSAPDMPFVPLDAGSIPLVPLDASVLPDDASVLPDEDAGTPDEDGGAS